MAQVEHILHGTTVATNAVLEGKGVNVGLITTEGHRQILHIDRSFVPGVSRKGGKGGEGRRGSKKKKWFDHEWNCSATLPFSLPPSLASSSSF